ncbi:hypothetical protein Tco_0962905 [Tanacetum coccineum]
MQTEEDLRGDDLKHYEAEIEARNLILISIPNDIYNSVDACITAQAMWQRVERLMRGTVQKKVDRKTRFKNEFDQFVAEPGESLVSVYNCFAQLMNDLERNDIKFPKVTRLTEGTYDDLFNYLQQFEKLVNASRAKKLEKSHDPLALVAHMGSSSRTTSPYYVRHPSSVVDYDDDYQGDAVQNTSEDPLTSAMILLSCAITQRFSNPTNNRLCTSSNTKNQAIVQGDRVNIQSRNSGNDGRNTRRSYVQEEIIEVRKVIMLVIVLSQEFEIQSTSWNNWLSYDSAFLNEVQTPSTSYVNPLFAKDNQEQKYPQQPKIINNTIGDDQIDSNIIFDEPNEDVNSGSVEYDNNVQESY